MSAFIVFGLTKEAGNDAVMRARRSIAKKVNRFSAINDRELTLAEYDQLLSSVLPEEYQKAVKAVSAPFCAPQFCRDFIVAAEKCKFAHSMKIMVRGTITKKVRRKGGECRLLVTDGWTINEIPIQRNKIYWISFPIHPATTEQRAAGSVRFYKRIHHEDITTMKITCDIQVVASLTPSLNHYQDGEK